MVNIEELFKIKEHPQTPSYRSLEFRWNNIEKIPEFAKLKECEQNPKWHSEGDAYKHTQLVCKYAIEKVNEYAMVHDTNHEIYNIAKNFDKFETHFLEPEIYNFALTLLTAALFHDIGKGITTAKGKDGNWHAYNHEFEGEKLTRQLLWDERVEFREDVCSLVKYHMLPINLFERKNYMEEMVKLAHNVPSMELLFILKECDLEGSIQKDENLKEKDRLILKELEEIAQIMGIYDKKSLISNFYRYNTHPFQNRKHTGEAYLDSLNKKPINLIMMMGLPGAGKDTFVNETLIVSNKDEETFINLPEISVLHRNTPLSTVRKKNAVIISRDIIRAKLGFCKEGEKIVGTGKQEQAVNEEIKRELYEAANDGKTIIVSNISSKKEHRAEYLRLLSNYDVKVTYIYVEASEFAKNVERRKGQISEGRLYDMIKGIEWPDFYEYDNFFYVRT